MKTAQFNNILNRLKQLREEQENLYNHVKSNPTVTKWTLEQLRANTKKAIKLQSNQDMLFDCDLYHILNMGNLTVIQTSQFLKEVKEVGRLRSFIKQVANLHMTNGSTFEISNEDLTNISKGKYTSKFLGIELKEI